MAKLTKRQKQISETIDPAKLYAVEQAFELLKKLSAVKFKESVDVSVRLGVDSKKSDQMVRGSTVLPNGCGKDVKVAVFAQGENADAAKEAGADIVGLEDLAEKIKKGELGFDVVIATPDAMRVVGQLGQILGPRGLMPNPKEGTVTQDVTTAVKNQKAGQARYKVDKSGIVHCAIGRIDFEAKALIENLHALLSDLIKAKPASAKGQYLQKICVSSTMGPGLTLDKGSLDI